MAMTKLKYYKAVTQPEITYASKTIFIDNLLKIEKKNSYNLNQ